MLWAPSPVCSSRRHRQPTLAETTLKRHFCRRSPPIERQFLSPLTLMQFLAWSWILTVSVIAQSPESDEARNTLLFISDVLAKTEYDNSNDARTVRWEKAPEISVFGDRNRHSVLVQRSIKEINKVLPEKRQIVQLPDETDSASIKIYFIASDKFGEIGKAHGFEVIKGNRGFYSVDWNDQYEIETACVLIAEDRLSGKCLSHFVLEELTQVMGLVGDSTRIPASLFYENPEAGKYGDATHLTAVDRRLIKFLYDHVPAGSFPIELGALVERHWKSCKHCRKKSGKTNKRKQRTVGDGGRKN